MMLQIFTGSLFAFVAAGFALASLVECYWRR